MSHSGSSRGEVAFGEDWWSVIIGLGIVCIAYGLFAWGASLSWAATTPRLWSSPAGLSEQLAADWPRYLFQFLAMLSVFAVAAKAMGQNVATFAGGFVLVYCLSFAALAIGAWDEAQNYTIEPPLIALAIGAIIANTVRLPRGLMEAFRVEFYVKTGIVLLGATLPITLIVWAGPIAIAQASIASVVTFLVIYRTALFLELDRKLAALLAAGGSVCGVSAVIAIAGAIRARREHMTIALTSVVFWSIVMIFILPLLARAWYLPAGVGGAWIGTSEFADAAGFVAAHTYGAFAREGVISGTPDQAIWSYTLLKVVGRDMWIGIWAVILSFVAMTRWETPEIRRRVTVMDIWHRFPKFILGLFAASLLATLASRHLSYADFETAVRPSFISPLTNLRGWVFTFSFLSIGLTTRLGGFAPAGGNAFIAFAAGVVVNLVLGFVLSAVVFQSYWANLVR
ncbi:MAG: putative sulfate exporter family transporter [Acetobacteraceae bacterium]|nr:putative sulfate exporter family transporter [Acetobacteraceae bacterium]